MYFYEHVTNLSGSKFDELTWQTTIPVRKFSLHLWHDLCFVKITFQYFKPNRISRDQQNNQCWAIFSVLLYIRLIFGSTVDHKSSRAALSGSYRLPQKPVIVKKISKVCLYLIKSNDWILYSHLNYLTK